jgi:hypothetical protein
MRPVLSVLLLDSKSLKWFHRPSKLSNLNRLGDDISSSSSWQPYLGRGLPQKLLSAEVSGYCFFRFRDKSLFQGGVVSSTPNPQLSWRVSLSRLVQVLKRQYLVLALAWISSINVAQEPWRGHACNGLGRNKWYYSSVVSMHLSARCIPSRPRTTPSTPDISEYLDFILLGFKAGETRLVLWLSHRNLPFYPFICINICLFTHLPISLPACLSACLSVRLSVAV